MFTLFAGLVLGLQAGGSSADVAPRWSVQVGPARCTLQRRGASSVSALAIDTVPGSDSYRVVITTPGATNAARFAAASLTFAPTQKALSALASGATLPNGTAYVRMDGIPPVLLDDLADADTLTMTIKSKVAGTVATPTAAKAVAAFRRCSADQLIEWGADAAQFEPGGHTPVAVKDRDDWISDKDLLNLARRSGRGSVEALFRIAVSATGAVSACRPLSESLHTDVTQVACDAVLGKTLFAPATDPAGMPVIGVATFRVMLIRQAS